MLRVVITVKISIVIPVYNVREYIEYCLESVVNQTYKNYDVILIDDGSDDGSEEICDEYCQKYKNFKVIHKSNGGISTARNEGIKYANGDYIIFVDSDDIVSNELCERISSIAIEQDPDVIQYEYLKFEEKIEIENYEKKYKNKTILHRVDNIDEIYKLYFVDETITRETWGKAYKREILKKIRFPEGRLAEDLATTYLILSKCKRIVYTSEKLYYYRIRVNSIMRSRNIKLYYDAMLGHFEIFEFINNNPQYAHIAYTNYFNNLMKLYAKNEIEGHNYKSDNIIDRYRKIKYRKLRIRGKIIFIISKINLKYSLCLIYKLFLST